MDSVYYSPMLWEPLDGLKRKGIGCQIPRKCVMYRNITNNSILRPTSCVALIRNTGKVQLSTSDQSKPDYGQLFANKAAITNRMKCFGQVSPTSLHVGASETNIVIKPTYNPKPSCSTRPDSKYTWSRKNQPAIASIAPVSFTLASPSSSQIAQKSSSKQSASESTSTPSGLAISTSPKQPGLAVNHSSKQLDHAKGSLSNTSVPSSVSRTKLKRLECTPTVCSTVSSGQNSSSQIVQRFSSNQSASVSATQTPCKVSTVDLVTAVSSIPTPTEHTIKTSPKQHDLAANQSNKRSDHAKGAVAKHNSPTTVSNKKLKRPACKSVDNVPCKKSKKSCPKQGDTKDTRTKCAQKAQNASTMPKPKSTIHKLECSYLIVGEKNEFRHKVKVQLSKKLDLDFFVDEVRPLLYIALCSRHSKMLVEKGLRKDNVNLLITSVLAADVGVMFDLCEYVVTESEEQMSYEQLAVTTKPSVSNVAYAYENGCRKRKYVDDV